MLLENYKNKLKVTLKIKKTSNVQVIMTTTLCALLVTEMT